MTGLSEMKMLTEEHACFEVFFLYFPLLGMSRLFVIHYVFFYGLKEACKCFRWRKGH